MKKSDSIGTKEFAQKYNVAQTTVAKWCREKLIDGASQDAIGSPCHIPKDALPPENSRVRKNIKK